MAPPIVFDCLRVLLGELTVTPRGIDRVDLSYARWFCENWQGDCYGLLPTPWGFRLYDRDQVAGLLESVHALWREDDTDDTDTPYRYLRARLAVDPLLDCTEIPRAQSRLWPAGFIARALRQHG